MTVKREDGGIDEERQCPETPMIGGARAYDIRVNWRSINWKNVSAIVGLVLVFLTCTSSMATWLGFDFARVGPGARFREHETEMRLRDSVATAGLAAIGDTIRSLRAGQDTIKETMVLFAEQLCDAPGRKSTRVRRRCARLFGDGLEGRR